MVFHHSSAEIRAAYASLVGQYEAVAVALRPDGHAAINMTDLQPGDNVLELGSGHGALIALAKKVVGHGVCVAVDVVQGHLTVDLPWTLRRQGLQTSDVHTLNTNITDGNLCNQLRTILSENNVRPTFDYIFAVHVIQTIPPQQRFQLLRTLHGLLTPHTGRLIADWSTRFPVGLPTNAEVSDSTPILFRTSEHAECPGCVVLVVQDPFGQMEIPGPQGTGAVLADQVITRTAQVAPDSLWQEGVEQVLDAARATGYTVGAIISIGKGDNHYLPPGPPTVLAHLNGMSAQQVENMMRNRFRSTNQIHHHVELGLEVSFRRQYPAFAAMSPRKQQLNQVGVCQRWVEEEVAYTATQHNEKLDWVQVGVLAEFRRP